MRRTWLLRAVVLAGCALSGSAASAEVTVQKTTWRGFEALQISNGTVELVLTTGIGPRIVRYGFVGGDNALGEMAPDAPPTKTALGEWRLYGGHRLWAGPEAMPRTYAPDSAPITATVHGSTVTLAQPTDAAGIEKVITVTLDASASGVTLGHRLT